MIARSYIITALEESIQNVNAAIYRLIMERTSILVFYHYSVLQPILSEDFVFKTIKFLVALCLIYAMLLID